MLKPGVAFSDVVVLKSSRILVDESALTGESTPVFKVGVDPSLRYHNYSQMRHKSFTISAGTRVLEVDDINGALGIVMTTGSFTTKGRLLTDVFSYQSHNFEFMDEVKVVLFILAVEAIILLSLVLYFLNDKWVFAWFYGTLSSFPWWT